MGAPPGAKAQVMATAHVAVADALGVPDAKGAHPVLDRPGDHGLRCLVLALADAPAVAGLLPALGPPQLAPAPRPPLAPGGGPLSPPPPPRPCVGGGQGGPR